MSRERIIKLLEEHLRFARKRIEEQDLLLEKFSEQIEHLTAQLQKQSETIRSLQEALVTKDTIIQQEKEGKSALAKLINPKSEKQKTPLKKTACEEPTAVKVPAVRKGNNQAKRKEFFDLEEEEIDVYPDSQGFDPAAARLINTTDSIRYKVIPPRFIKQIYHLHTYKQEEKILSGKAPATPFLNSNYDASILAYMIQLRYIYSLPIERILKLFSETGFNLNKSTAHGLIAKAATLFEYLEAPLKEAILEDQYVHIDEVPHRVLKSSTAQAGVEKSMKAYIWAILAHNRNLIQFFYDKGSRAGKVVKEFFPTNHQGVIQSDGYAVYKIFETDDYLDVHRLPCLQHCKRKFLDMANNKQAQKIVDKMNQLYQIEHRRPPDLSDEEKLTYKNKYILPILDELETKLIRIQQRKSTLPKSKMAKAVNYTLGEFKALRNILLFPDCDLDNNAIERNNRYIALSRKNSLFFANHNGARNGMLIYSLACSCRLNNINTFEYFKDILNKLADVTPNTDREELRNLLPDKWGK